MLFFLAQFGPWTFGPQHGFARISRWNIEKTPDRLSTGDIEAIFSMVDNDFTRSMWNYQWVITFRLQSFFFWKCDKYKEFKQFCMEMLPWLSSTIFGIVHDNGIYYTDYNSNLYTNSHQ